MKLILIAIIIVSGFVACAQSKFTPTKTYAFFRQNLRGALRVDDNNEPVNAGPDSQYVAYIEAPLKVEPVWTKAWINNQTFDIFPTKVNGPVVVGEKKSSGEKIELNPKPTGVVWELTLQKGEKEFLPAKYKAASGANNIIIKGTYKKQDVYVVVSNIVELSPIIYP